MTEHRAEGTAATAGPTPDTNSFGVEKRVFFQQCSGGVGVVIGIDCTKLEVRTFSPGVPFGRIRTTRVDAANDEALLGEHGVPKGSWSAPGIFDGLAVRLAVDVHEERVFLRGVEVGRGDHVGVELEAVVVFEAQKFGFGESE